MGWRGSSSTSSAVGAERRYGQRPDLPSDSDLYGNVADVVGLDGDPAEDIRALARVRATLRAGRVIYRR